VSVREFLVVYDYGTGGIWGFARARTEAEIVQTFPELKVCDESRSWLTHEEERKVRSVSSFAVGEPSTYPEWLRTLVAERRAS
jgi:hypothetical protein